MAVMRSVKGRSPVRTEWARCAVSGLLDPDRLLIDFRPDEPCQVSQRFLPTEITSRRRNNVRHTCLRDIHFGANRYLLQHHPALHLIGHIGLVELSRGAQALPRRE